MIISREKLVERLREGFSFFLFVFVVIVLEVIWIFEVVFSYVFWDKRLDGLVSI